MKFESCTKKNTCMYLKIYFTILKPLAPTHSAPFFIWCDILLTGLHHIENQVLIEFHRVMKYR